MHSIWIPEPISQNFSSLFREATAAQEAKTGMEHAHHLTASLYFGLAAVEAFLNERMRERMKGRPAQVIVDKIRQPKFAEKLHKWPAELLKQPYKVRKKTVDSVLLFYDVRGNLIHPKIDGHEIYSRLEKIKPAAVIEAVAEIMVRFYEAEESIFPYWLFGWNYLNPRTSSHDIQLFNNQQFCWSLQVLGFNVSAGAGGDKFQQTYMMSFDGYLEVSNTLRSLDRCAPKDRRFPYLPILCRRWWTPDHQRTCGNVTKQAIKAAM